ncbi:LPS export ABC transporter periplasmic protein LptC [Thalassococcus sp. BH17M4-6]|uniref:LPS export ABC transporter periplasmic protein LptC n=1 Tax=Thalassococcus sp. BH17M4-6 TaxID=3413148 RepID=UPI003BD92A0A
MARTYSRYSRMVAWLKILLPMVALGLLSTIFLLSRDSDPTDRVPFSVVGIDGDIAREQVSEPRFAGTTTTGASLTMNARVARPSPDVEGQVDADQLDARIVMDDGSEIELTAPTASMRDSDDQAELKGGVTIQSSTGYTLTTQSLLTSLARVEAESRGRVEGDGPLGTLKAGRMQITTPEGSDDLHLLFTGGVNLIYLPQTE